MIDPKQLRTNTADIAANLARRGFEFDAANFQVRDARRKELQVEVENARSERNSRSKSVGKAKAAGEDIQPLLDEVAKLGATFDAAEAELKVVQNELDTLAWGLPNTLDDSVPEGPDESANVELRKHGEPRHYDFDPLDHVDLGQRYDGIDFAAAAKMSGARFAVLRGEMARLQRSLVQFMLDLHTRVHGYTEVYVPLLVEPDALRGTGQLPKFGEDLFKVEGERELHLIPTAEVPITNLVRDSILSDTNLPLKWVAHTPCFRSEAGSYGRDTRGMIRQHQFEKVELVQVVRPEDAESALEELTGHAEAVLQKLELPYRAVALASGDVGFSATKTYDLEVWLPGQSAYREISSCSWFSDFQARRMQARFKRNDHGKPELVHTLNGSGVAAGRALVAILENFQNSDGSVTIPDVLRPYFGDQTRILKSR